MYIYISYIYMHIFIPWNQSHRADLAQDVHGEGFGRHFPSWKGEGFIGSEVALCGCWVHPLNPVMLVKNYVYNIYIYVIYL